MSTETAATLRLPWTSLLSREDLVRHVARHPMLSWYVPGTSSYLIAGPWRNREDIVEIYETRGERHRAELWQAVNSQPATHSAVVIDPSEHRSAVHFYRHVGVRVLEDVLVLRTAALPGLEVRQTLEMVPMRSRGLSTLLDIDHSAFPWLWRNSRQEFQEYLETPGVGLWVGVLPDQAVGYVGFTTLGGWGHVDRLAVVPQLQGLGYGAELLSWAMRRLYELGAKYVQLSTQGSNERSQPLYTRFGFRPTRGSYKLYGMYL
ncbi:MAG: GNAT family N-acetyltransferase [Chloroflexota bacterium]|nr:GNAT family N-acetyltransferase [Chloroflexota bacterium]